MRYESTARLDSKIMLNRNTLVRDAVRQSTDDLPHWFNLFVCITPNWKMSVSNVLTHRDTDWVSAISLQASFSVLLTSAAVSDVRGFPVTHIGLGLSSITCFTFCGRLWSPDNLDYENCAKCRIHRPASFYRALQLFTTRSGRHKIISLLQLDLSLRFTEANKRDAFILLV